ncbi:MAG: hypothetical protein ACM31E_01260 [Fibrobacterota bacterium]|nr:hypothetical protein [Chitinispirillaceae bacterium]
MSCSCSATVNYNETINVQIRGTEKKCAAGERRGTENATALKIPVYDNQKLMCCQKTH